MNLHEFYMIVAWFSLDNIYLYQYIILHYNALNTHMNNKNNNICMQRVNKKSAVVQSLFLNKYKFA